MAGQANPQLVTVFGGSGFIGRMIVRALAGQGYRVRVAVRRPDLAGAIQPLGGPGQIHAVQANLRDAASVARAVEGADAVVNCVGILFESGKQKFAAIQTEGARHVAEAAKAAGITRMVHLSAIGADATSEALYARSKADGEAAVLAAVPEAIILRPSVVFGPEDDFFNRFAAMAPYTPFMPLVAGGKTRFQPVYVGDVAEMAARGIMGHLQNGQTYELGGPDIMSLRETIEYVLKVIRRKRLLISLPTFVAKVQAFFFEFMPKPMLTRDQIKLLQHDNLVSDVAKAEGRTLEGVGITPRHVAGIAPDYLWRFRKHGEFNRDD